MNKTLFSFKGYLHAQNDMTPINKLLNPIRDLKANMDYDHFPGMHAAHPPSNWSSLIPVKYQQLQKYSQARM